MFGLAFIPIVLALGATVDYSRAARAKAQLQEAADAAVLAAATQPGLTQSARQSLAQSVALANLTGAGWSVAPTVTETEPSGNYQVTVNANLPTAFMQFAGIGSVNLSATSMAAGAKSTTTTTTTTTAANVCLLVLSKTISPAFLANADAVINAPNCEVDVASTGAPAATFNATSALNVNSFCLAGTNILNNGGSVTNLEPGCTVASDPFAGKLPAVTVGACTETSPTYSGATTLSPGVYCNGANFNGSSGSLTLLPGLYIITGGSWNLNTGWSVTGTGVTVYYADSSYIQFNGTAQANLTAPTTGTYANILMYEAPNLPVTPFTINAGPGAPDALAGLIYLPSRNITFNSNASTNSAAITMVVNSLILDPVTWNWTASAFGIASASSTQTTTTSATSTSPLHLIQ